MSLFVDIERSFGAPRRPASIDLTSAIGTPTRRWNAPRERPVPAPAVRISPSLRLSDENAAHVRGVDFVAGQGRQRHALTVPQTGRLNSERRDLGRIDPPMDVVAIRGVEVELQRDHAAIVKTAPSVGEGHSARTFTAERDRGDPADLLAGRRSRARRSADCPSRKSMARLCRAHHNDEAGDVLTGPLHRELHRELVGEPPWARPSPRPRWPSTRSARALNTSATRWVETSCASKPHDLPVAFGH